jgi:hypothetical protein
VIGVVQEQHSDRARLYRQWRQLDWTIFVDSLNVLGHSVVPIPMKLDKDGRILEIQGRARSTYGATPADRLFYAGEHEKALGALDPDDWFRRGVILRARYESDGRKPGDGQAAVEAWAKALKASPNQYIWRRRLQQYGPRLAKPYNFYDWVATARVEIRARGEQPVELREEPRGAELIARGAPAAGKPVDADPEGKIEGDRQGLIRVETIVTPTPVRPGHSVRVRLVFRPDTGLWNNEAGALTLFVKTGKGLKLGEGTFEHPPAKTAESNETRYLEFEVEATADGVVEGYALYYACRRKDGTCLYLRRDFKVAVDVESDAAAIQR